MRLCHPPDGSTSPKYKLLCFATTKTICKEKNALAFNCDRCCHLVLCSWLIPFNYLLSCIWNLTNLVVHFDNNYKCWIVVNTYSEIEKACWFEVYKFDMFNYLIWCDTKNVELKLKFCSDNWKSFWIWWFELIL